MVTSLQAMVLRPSTVRLVTIKELHDVMPQRPATTLHFPVHIHMLYVGMLFTWVNVLPCCPAAQSTGIRMLLPKSTADAAVPTIMAMALPSTHGKPPPANHEV